MSDSSVQHLKTSPNESIKQLWKSTNQHTNIQYDVYNSTKNILKEFHSIQEDKLNNVYLPGRFSQTLPSFPFHGGTRYGLQLNQINFTVRYMNSSLPSRKNFARWGLSFSPDCSFCLCQETLLHVVAGC